MKKVLVSLLALFIFMVSVPLAANAQSCYCSPRRSYRSARYTPRYRAVRYVSYVPVYRTRYVPRYRTSRYYAPSYRTARYAPSYRTYSSRSYRTAGYTYSRPSFYRRHRNVVNLGIATGAGALIGGIARGRRGAGIGALLGAGGGALYTYVLNKKRRRY